MLSFTGLLKAVLRTHYPHRTVEFYLILKAHFISSRHGMPNVAEEAVIILAYFSHQHIHAIFSIRAGYKYRLSMIIYYATVIVTLYLSSTYYKTRSEVVAFFNRWM